MIAGPAPPPRETAWLLRKRDGQPNTLRPEERDYVDAPCATCPPLGRVRSLATEFARLLKAHDSSALDPWLGAAEQSALRGFATSLRRDRDAVLAAVLLQWSNGQVEGQVQRLKLIKRTMYGRASFELLRRRVVGASSTRHEQCHTAQTQRGSPITKNCAEPIFNRQLHTA